MRSAWIVLTCFVALLAVGVASAADGDWHRAGPVWIGKPRSAVEQGLGTPGEPGSTCQFETRELGYEGAVVCIASEDTLMLSYVKRSGDCGPKQGCAHVGSCGVGGSCSTLETDVVQSLRLGRDVAGVERATSSTLAIGGVHLGDTIPLGPCVRFPQESCGHRWHGLRVKQLTVPGLGPRNAWQGRATVGGRRLWVVVWTANDRVTTISVESY